ncbi:MAG TPA: acyl-CoA dehydrogenase family protein [Blastocatellia bacterium]|nr:acyl-CoA dehydrogenase family protein [Blastocatellia bacterium]
MKLASTDLLDVDSLLSDEEKLVRATVRSFVEQEVNPKIGWYYEEGRFPIEVVEGLASLNVLGANLPEEYGCAGMSNVAYGLIMQELEACDSGIRSFASVQGALCMYSIFKFGSEEQKKKYLPEMASGKIIGCFGLTEPNFGSNPGGMLTRARRSSESWILNGTKAWITNGTIADVAVVWAKTEEGIIRGFLVEKGTKGFSAIETKHKLSLRASVTSELVFEDCVVPEGNILPLSDGLKSPLMCLTQARYGIAWGAVGAAISCFNTALKYSRERIQFGKPIASFQLTQQKLVTMLTEISKAELLSIHIGRLKDADKLKPVQVSMAKMNNVAIALDCARLARSILGANGITNEYPVMRHMCNLESVYTYEGTHEIHTLILGEAITGYSAFTDVNQEKIN